MKKTKIMYWVTTAIIVTLEGLITALTFNTEAAKQGVSHLGYPDYFRLTLAFFKVTGAIVLILPFFKGKLKDLAYAGFAFTFAFASISHFAIDGVDFQSFFPLIFLALLAVSYNSYQKLSGGSEDKFM